MWMTERVIVMTRNVLITGGSSGIGAEMVRRFARAGETVWLTYNHGRERAEALVCELEDSDVRAFRLALGDLDSHRALLDDLPGPVDILINNAGLGTKTVEAYSDDRHEQDLAMLRVNALGTLWLTEAILPTMRERGRGTIVILSSVGGGIGAFPRFRHSDGMSKAALAHLGRQLAAETVHEPINVFTVCPGAVDTPMFRASSVDHLGDAERAALMRRLPGGRMIEPGEIADLVVYLCSEAGRVLHGAVIDASFGAGVRPGVLTE
jgi:NAD(P)-dependent dehydrogenase (short-subunit alcohol dehydrogenase family)